MRLFAGLALPFEVRRNIEFLLEHVRGLAPVAWSPVENLHITTKFIGEWEEERLDELKSALRGMAKGGEFTVAVEGVGWFPNPHSPRVFFAAVKGEAALGELHARTDEALAAIGVERETKEFRPHLTLARIKDPKVDLLPVKKFVAGLPSTDFGRFRAAKFLLYKSVPGASHSSYSVIDEYPLT
ncbi:MAG: RNA 2',3'-cyclic phosphodiesterase [Bryobacteraceae bacterium]|nr:RNA 2',3'-cyclic phosphodiesterase [Bryobacteraceae bacterium]